jgi:CheY-like chemotaxis protein
MSLQPGWPTDHAAARTVLVVEDEALIRLAIAEDLRACGFEVLEASSAPEAIELLVRREKVDVVFSDIQMPGFIDGFGLARWISARRPEVSVVLTSAACSASNLPQEFRRSVPVVPKPYDLSTVLRHLRPRNIGRDLGRLGNRGQRLQPLGAQPGSVARLRVSR